MYIACTAVGIINYLSTAILYGRRERSEQGKVTTRAESETDEGKNHA